MSSGAELTRNEVAVSERGPFEPYHPLLELTRARLLEYVRDPGVIFWVFGFPVLLAIALGLAFRNKPPDKLRIAVTPRAAQTWSKALDAAGLDAVVEPASQAAHDLRSAKVDLWLVPTGPKTFALRFDSMRPEGRSARLAVDAAVQKHLGRTDVATFVEQTHAAVGGRYIDFLVPGLIGMNLMGSSMWGIGYAVVDTRKRKLLKRFAATPMRRSYFLLAFILSRVAFAWIEVAVLLAFGRLVFHVPVVGSLADVGVVSLLAALSFAGIAVLIAARPKSTEVASGWMNFAMLPMYLLSGSFFSYARFPAALQPAIKILPLTATNDALRAVINDGTGLAAIAAPLAILVAWAAVSFAVALRWFRWQ